jgi:hypothetical protein
MDITRCAVFAGVLTLSLAGFACGDDDTSPTAGSGGSGGASGKSGAGGAAGKSGAGGAAGKSGAGGGGGSGSATQSISIDAPANGASVGPTATYPDYPDVPVKFTVKNFVLMAPGSDMPAGKCAAGVCGHVHLLVDGTACNDTGNNFPYNNAGAASPIAAGLDYCPKIEGAHVITLELHNDDHSPVNDASGNVISAKIDITAAPANEPDAG